MAERRFTVRIDAEMGIGQVKTAVQQMQAELSKLSLPQDMGSKISGTFSKLTNEIEKFQAMSAKGIGSTQDFNQLASSGNKIIQIYEQLTNQVKSLGNLSDSQLQKLFPPSILSNITKATSAMEQYQNSMKGSRGQITELEKEIEKAKNKTAQLISQKEKLEKKTAVSDTTFAQLSKDAEEAKRKFEEAQTKLTELQNQAKQKVDAVGSSSLARKSSTYRGLVDNDIPAQEAEVAKLEQAWNRVENKKNKALSQSQKDETIANLIKDIQNAEGNIDQLKNQLNQLKIGDGQSFQQLINQLNQINGIKLDPATATIKDAQQAISKLSAAELEKLRNSFSGFSASVESGRAPIQNFNSAIDGTRTKVEQLDQTMSEVDMLKSRVNYFFGLTNSVFLFKRAITSALNTVKELDAVMTETAVVTDFTIGDMWEKLPEYSDKASALGASIKDLYAATTLYYQQGLKTNEAMGVGVETMKMARIANMEASDATQAMTAALRGFNMEVNEMNAQKVNDVYSELAAITAADTSQIATAMSKTASIAASANMEFETTAALLAQIIETTQEAPETAGTAMKTIIARFTEVKKLFSEGQLTGEDEEGEVIEINKIDTALRSVGISLKDFLSGSKGIDDIFLELASKWNTLDLATQRYIATTAAGSRQQSRFIAMMSNYDRTMELVTAANNSAGASQEQFEKTLDSMDAKLQKLKNAWAEFTMGLANNEILKGGIDLITGLLKAINGLTEAISGGNGVVKSVLSLGVAFMGLKTGGAVLNGILASISQAQAGQGFNLGKNVKTGFTNAFAGLKNIQPNIPKIDFNTAGLKAYQTSLTSLQASLASVTAAEEACAIAKSTGLQIDTANATMTNAVAAADRDLAVASTELATATGLSNVQAQDAVLMNAEGLSLDMAILAAKAGITSAEYSEMAAKMANAGATDAEVQAELRLMLAKKGVYIAQNQGIIGRLEEIVMTKLHTAAINGNIIAHKLEEAALKSKTAAMWVSLGVIGLIISAVALLTAGTIALAKYIKSISPEGKLEAATEAANKAAEAAENAAAAYDKLNSSLESIEGKEAELENLAAGTREWKDAVADLNNEVLDLITAYPELAQYVDSQDGVLRFTDEGAVEDILNSYADAEINAQSAKAAAQIEVQKRQQDVDFSNLSYNAKIIDQGNSALASAYLTGDPATIAGASIGAYLSGQSMQAYDQIDQKATEELAKAYASGEIDENDAKLDYLAGDRVALNELRAFGQSLIASEAAIDAYSEAILNNAAIASELSDEQKSELEGLIGPDGIQSLIDTEKQALEQKTSKDLREEYAKAMNYEIVDGKIYSGYGEDRKEVIVSDDEIKSQLAAINVQNKLTGAMKNLTGIIEDVSPEIANLFSGAEGKELTSSDIAALQGYLNKVTYGEDETAIKEGELYDIYTELGLEGIYGTFDNFIKQVTDSVDLGNKRITEAQTKLESIGATTDFFNNLNSEQLSGIADNIYSVFLSSGKDVALGLTNQINGYMQSMSPEQAQKFAEGLNMIDWSNIDSVEELDKILIELGFDAELAGIDVESLENEIASAAKAAKKFNLDTLKEEIKSIDSLIDNLKNREDGDRTFSKEERDLMVQSDESLKDDFVMTGIDEFIYVGDSIQSLILALSANTAALLGQYGEQIAYDAEQSRKWQAIVDKGETWTSGSTEYEILRDIATGEKTADQFQQAGLFALMKKAGIDFNEEEVAGNNTLIADLVKASYEKYGTVAQRENYFQSETDYVESLEQKEYYDKDNIQMQQSLNKTNEAGKVYGQYATTEESEKIAAALRAQAIEWGVNQTVIEQFNKSLEDNNNILDDTTAAILTNAISDKKATKQLEKTAKKITEVTKKYEDLNEVTTEDVQKIGEALGLEDLEEGSDNFNLVEDNLNLINEAMNGDIDSMQELQNLMAQGLGLTVNADTGFVDMSEIYDEAGNVEQAAIDAMNALIEAGAFEIETVEVEQDGEYDVPIIENGMITGFEKKTYQAGQTYQVVKPVDAPQIKQATQDTGGGGGGGGGGGSEETWENPYDKLYNLTREINEELRERERIERRYEKLLEKRLATAEQLSELSFSELDQLELEAELQREFISGRQQQIADLLAENPDMEQYFTVSTDENGEQIIRIDWNAINAVTDTEEGERIEENLGKVEDWSGDIEDANDTLNDIEDTVFEIKQRGKDEYMDLEDQIKEALTQVYQDEIDKLSDINDSINDTNSRLLDAVQRSIDEQRQERENAKTEEELSDKRSRLAYLQQDTSGANALEILKLQEEIAQGEEDYTDSLIDQKISELQRQNDEAAAQREQQINIAQAQLDHYIETGAIWQEVYSLMTSGLNEKTGLIRGSRLEEVLQKAENFSGLSAIGKMEWLKDLETNIASALSYLRVGRQIEDLGITSGQISFTTKDGKTLTGTVDSSGNVTTSDGKVFDDVYQGSNGFYYSNKTEAEGTVKKPEPPAPTTPVVTKKTNPYGNASETTGLIYEGMTGTQVKSIQWALKEMGYDIGAEGIDGVYGWATKRAVTQFQTDFHREYPGETMGSPDGIVGPNTRNAFRIKQYKTGGLADFTGPAWLDGTKSRPEYILNADQTKAFFELVDVLSALKTNSSTTTQNSGDNTYDIDINVESIGSDYDVEQLANTVKRLINDDARYRNNNIAGHTR